MASTAAVIPAPEVVHPTAAAAPIGQIIHVSATAIARRTEVVAPTMTRDVQPMAEEATNPMEEGIVAPLTLAAATTYKVVLASATQGAEDSALVAPTTIAFANKGVVAPNMAVTAPLIRLTPANVTAIVRSTTIVAQTTISLVALARHSKTD